MPGIDPGVLLAQRLNDLVLALALAGAILVPPAVARHARRSGLSWARAALWAAVSLVFFPLGVGLYLVPARPASQTGMAGEPPQGHEATS